MTCHPVYHVVDMTLDAPKMSGNEKSLGCCQVTAFFLRTMQCFCSRPLPPLRGRFAVSVADRQTKRVLQNKSLSPFLSDRRGRAEKVHIIARPLGSDSFLRRFVFRPRQELHHPTQKEECFQNDPLDVAKPAAETAGQ